jgi:CRP-like cAMP-binding protein
MTKNDDEDGISGTNEHEQHKRPPPRRSMFVRLQSTPELALFRESSLPFSAPVGSGTVDFGQQRFAAGPGALVPADLQVNTLQAGILLISLGSSKTSGAQLDAIAQWLSSTSFKHIQIMPADYIYRLTLQLLHPNLSDEDAQAAAICAALDFKAHASPIFAQYSHACDFEWVPMSQAVAEHKEAFVENYRVLQKLHKDDPAFRDTVREFSLAYMERVDLQVGEIYSKQEDGDEVKDEDGGDSVKEEDIQLALRVQKVARTYLLEECSIFAALGESNITDEPTNLIYAGTIDSMVDLCEGKFEKQPHGFTNVNFIQAKIERRGQFFPDGAKKVLRTGSLTVGSFQRPMYSRNFLSELGEEGREQLFRYTKKKRFRTGQAIVKAGTRGNKLFKNGALYFIVEGRVEEFLMRGVLVAGHQQRVGIVDVGAMVVDRDFLEADDENHFTAIPLVETEVQGLTRQSFEKMAQELPSLAMAVMRAIAQSQTTRNMALMHELQHMRLQEELMEDSAATALTDLDNSEE